MTSAFWALFFVPWILDLLSGQGVLLTVFGALLWGASLGAALVGGTSKDQKFKQRCRNTSMGLALGWIIYWACGFFYPSLATSVQRPLLIKLFVFFHAGLLSSALGLMAVLFLTSLGWLIHEFSLSKPSWERRQNSKTLRLPSLETLAKGSKRAIICAFRIWGMGLFLAAVTTYLQGRFSNSDAATHTWRWVSDPKVLFTTSLWLFLYLGLRIERLFTTHKRWRYRSYLAFSVFFVGIFIWFMSSKATLIHQPLDWFLR